MKCVTETTQTHTFHFLDHLPPSLPRLPARVEIIPPILAEPCFLSLEPTIGCSRVQSGETSKPHSVREKKKSANSRDWWKFPETLGCLKLQKWDEQYKQSDASQHSSEASLPGWAYVHKDKSYIIFSTWKNEIGCQSKQYITSHWVTLCGSLVSNPEMHQCYNYSQTGDRCCGLGGSQTVNFLNLLATLKRSTQLLHSRGTHCRPLQVNSGTKGHNGAALARGQRTH